MSTATSSALQLVAGPFSNVLATVYEGDAAAELFGLLQIMSRQQDRGALFVYLLDVLTELEAKLNVTVCGGFVKDQ